MTARRVVTLTCDKGDCTMAYVGGAGQHVRQVRAEAKKLAGWSVLYRSGDPKPAIDLCRWHS